MNTKDKMAYLIAEVNRLTKKCDIKHQLIRRMEEEIRSLEGKVSDLQDDLSDYENQEFDA